MRTFLLVLSLTAATFASVSAARAEITLEPITCPFPADAAFKVVGAKGESDGVDVEYKWLSEERRGWSRTDQATLNSGSEIYDMLTIHKGSKTQNICFDITDFFGKMD
jgi:hypothetical protein